jgi:hypothetical protein
MASALVQLRTAERRVVDPATEDAFRTAPHVLELVECTEELLDVIARNAAHALAAELQPKRVARPGSHFCDFGDPQCAEVATCFVYGGDLVEARLMCNAHASACSLIFGALVTRRSEEEI